MKLLNFYSKIFLVLAAVSGLLWPLFYNGQAFFFPDTSAYLRGAAAGISRLTGHTDVWSQAASSSSGLTSAADSTSGQAAATRKTVSSIEEKTILSGRSVYYGALLHISSFDERFWLAPAVQAFLVVLAAALTLHACGALTPLSSAAAVLLLALTPASLFTSFLMPDIFASLAILSCANLLVRTPARPWMLGFWTGLLLFSLLAHSSHVLIAACFAGFGLVLRILHHRPTRTWGAALIGAALLAAYAGNAAFEAAVTQFVGEPPIRPPFLTARMIADGPGYQFMRAACPDSGYTVCRFMDCVEGERDAETLLWSSDPKKGFFSAVDPATRRALAAEQYRFAAAVLRQHPLDQLLASVRNAAQLFVAIKAKEFQYSEINRDFFIQKLPPGTLAVLRESPAFRGAMPVQFLTMLNYATAALGCAALIWLLAATRRTAAAQLSTTKLLAVLLTAGVTVNAAICGAFSGPFDRYQARVVWLLPFAALLLWSALRAKKSVVLKT